MINAKEMAPDLSHRQILVVLFGLIAGMFVGVLDQTVFGTALPTIVGEFHGVEHMQWVITAYALTSAIVLPISGKLGDRLGHKQIFMAAIGVFLLGSVVGAVAQSMSWLIIARSIQGLGGGSLMVLAMSVMSHVAPPDKMRRYTPIFGITFGASFVIGPLIGGILSAAHVVPALGLVTSWRWVFWLNIPVGIVALTAIALFVPKLPIQELRPKFDTRGITFLSLASVATVLVTSWGGLQYDWGSPIIVSLIVGAFLCAALFVATERKSADPIMPLELFKNRNFSLVTVAGLVLGVVMMGTMAYLPTYLQMATGASATMSGVYMMPMVLGMLVVSKTVNIVITRTGRYKWAPLSGMAVMGVGLVLLHSMTSTTSIWYICTYLGLMGAGMGMSMQTLMAIVRNEVPLMMAGTGNATNMYFRTIGMTLGASFIGSVFASNLINQLTKWLPPGMSIGEGGRGALTPTVVNSLPDNVRSAVLMSYSDALTPIFLWIVPLVVFAFVVLLFLKETPFKTTLDYGTLAESFETDELAVADTALVAEDTAVSRKVVPKVRHRVKKYHRP